MTYLKERRKSFLVDRDFQGAYAAFVLHGCALFFVGGFVLFCGIAGVNFWFIRSMGMSAQMEAAFWSAVGLNLVLLIGVFAVCAALVLSFALWISHRIAGPAFSYERRLRAMSFGDVQAPFASRAKDQLKELEESLNRFRVMVQKNFEELENQRQTYMHKLGNLEDDAQRFRLQHVLKFPVLETLERHTGRRYTG